MVPVPQTNLKQFPRNHLDSLAHEIRTADNTKDVVDRLLEYFRVLREGGLVLPLHTYFLSLGNETRKDLKNAKERMFVVLRETFSQMESFIAKKRLPKTHIVNTHIRHFRRFSNADTLDPEYEIMDFGNPHGIELTKTIPDRKRIEGMHSAIMGMCMPLIDLKDGESFLWGNGIIKESDQDRDSWEPSYKKEWFEYDRLYREISKIMAGHPWTCWMHLLEIHFHFQWDIGEYEVVNMGLEADEVFWLLYNPTYQHLEDAYSGQGYKNDHYGFDMIWRALMIIHPRITGFIEGRVTVLKKKLPKSPFSARENKILDLALVRQVDLYDIWAICWKFPRPGTRSMGPHIQNDIDRVVEDETTDQTHKSRALSKLLKTPYATMKSRLITKAHKYLPEQKYKVILEHLP